MAKPITPSEVIGHKANQIPDEVYEAFNELIAEKWNGHSANIKQDAVCNRIVEKMQANGASEEPHKLRSTLFSKGYMDVEDIYRKAGWRVKYDKPAYCENYEAYFVFERPRE